MDINGSVNCQNVELGLNKCLIYPHVQWHVFTCFSRLNKVSLLHQQQLSVTKQMFYLFIRKQDACCGAVSMWIINVVDVFCGMLHHINKLFQQRQNVELVAESELNGY
jgi:flagellar biosynthesis protein FlhB